MRNLFLVFFCMLSIGIHAQENYSILTLKDTLVHHADAVIRDYKLDVHVNAVDDITIYTTRVVTVFNAAGARYIRAYESYDESMEVNEQRAWVYNSFGEEVEKFKERDFLDQSSFQSFVLFSDNRVSYLDYTARSYPYTIKYVSEVETINSIFLQDFTPLEGYNVSVENYAFNLHNPAQIPVRFDKLNFENVDLKEEHNEFELSFEVHDLPAKTSEVLSPDFESMNPRIRMALQQFNLEGVHGSADDWKQFGKWMYDNLVEGRDHLSELTKRKITQLVQDAPSLEEKARRIYQYVQDNTRYIAVMYGIGGWEPASADEVDHLGYGDCKALTNYTKALLDSQGIESYYTVVYGGEKRHLDPSFTQMGGNHVILNIPSENEDMWLECTSQTVPFNYMGDFTDDRYVLRLKPEGGEIIRTKKYDAKDNRQNINCQLDLHHDGSFEANFERTSTGVPYGDVYRLPSRELKDQKRYYRNEWSDLQNVDFEKIEYEDDRENIEFREMLRFKGERLATKAGDRLLIPLNFVQQSRLGLRKNEDRKLPLLIERGKTYEDQFSFVLPENFEIEALPESQKFDSEFGNFDIAISVEDGERKKISVERKFVLNEGEWPAARYEEFRDFLRQIDKLNNLKAVILHSPKT